LAVGVLGNTPWYVQRAWRWSSSHSCLETRLRYLESHTDR